MNPDNTAYPGVPGPYTAPLANVGGPAVPGPLASPPVHPGVNPMLHHPGQATPPHQQPGGHAAPSQPAAPSAPPVTATQPASSTQHSVAQVAAGSVPPSATHQVSGEAPVRTSLRTGTQATGTHAAVGTTAASPSASDDEHGGVLKGLGRLVKRRDDDDPTSAKAARAAGGPRRVRAMVTTVDPWSIMKLAFLLSIAAGVMFVVAASIVWSVLNGMGVFTSIKDQVETLFGTETETSITQFLEKDKVMSIVILLAVVNSILMTGLATIGSMLYNLVVKLVGGVYVTLTDE